MEIKDKSSLKYCYEYPRPAVTADCIVFGFTGEELRVLLIERKYEPYKGYWAFPGGFINPDEDIETCVKRELQEETGMTGVDVEQLYTFSRPDRDPRHRTITVAYFTLIRLSDSLVIAGDDAARAEWFPITALPTLAFDHDEILEKGMARVKEVIMSEHRLIQQFSNKDKQKLQALWR